VDGAVEIVDLDRTEENRDRIRDFVDTVLIGGAFGKLENFVVPEYAEHNPTMTDGTAALRTALEAVSGDAPVIHYQVLHRVLADGCFVLSVCEGRKAGEHSAFYDLYRLVDGCIVEHWDTVEKIAPRSEWKNDNGKF